jgi:hypothetical protein
MKYAAIHAQRETYSTRMMCRVLGVSRSGYYQKNQGHPHKS